MNADIAQMFATAMPELATMAAAALLLIPVLIPFGMITLRMLRRNRKA